MGRCSEGLFDSVYQEKVPSLGKVHLACLSVMTTLILSTAIGRRRRDKWRTNNLHDRLQPVKKNIFQEHKLILWGKNRLLLIIEIKSIIHLIMM